MNVKNILLFVSGLAVGGAAGVFGTKKYFENKYQKCYEKDHDALEEYYHRTDEYARGDSDDDEEEFEDDGINSPEVDSRPGGRMTPEERAAVKEKLNKNWGGTTNYAEKYREKNGYMEEKLAEAQHPLDPEPEICENCNFFNTETHYCSNHEEVVNLDDSCSDFYTISETSPEEQAFDEHQKNKNKPPKIISADAYSNLPAHIENEVLYFYAYDEQLCDDNEEPVENPEYLIGDALTKFGFVDSDERIIFVMNYTLDTCYEIQKVDASWTDTH